MQAFLTQWNLAALASTQGQRAVTDEWTAVGHGGGSWLWTLQHFAPLLFGLLLAALLVQACRVRMRYRAVEVLDMGAVDRLRRAVQAAESETTGEIGVVVLERSDAHPEAPWAGAVFLTILASLASAHLLDHLPIWPVLLIQVFLGYIFYTLIWAATDLRRRFVTSARATEMADEQAVQEFHALKLSATKEHTGVLLFTSLFERRVIVLADEGIADRVDEDIWLEVNRAVLAGAKREELEQGLLNGIRLVGTVLQKHFPAEPGGEDQVENHVIVRKE